MADFIVGDEALQRRFRALSEGKADRRILTEFGALAVAFAKADVPRKTGNLGRTIRVASVDPRRQQVRIVAGGSRNVGYAGLVEFGTKAHTIKPKNKKSLFFPSQYATTKRFGAGAKLKFRLSGNLTAGSLKKYGNAAFQHAKVVHHPGTKPKPYLVPGAEKALARVDKAGAIIETWNNAA